MTPRERVLAALNHEMPDKMPTDLGTTNVTSIVLGTYNKLKAHYGVTTESDIMFSPFQIVNPDEKVLEALQIDTRGLPGDYDAYERKQWLNEDEYLDSFGITYRMPPGGLYYDFYKSPLEPYDTVEEMEDNYTWPDPIVPEEVAGLREKAQKLKAENKYAIVGDVVNCGIWERSQNVRGFQQLLMDLLDNEEVAHYILRHMVDHQKARMEQYLNEVGEYLDVVCAFDDLATGRSTVMSIETFRTMVKPYMAEYWGFLKERAPHAKLMYHSCGAIEPFIDDLCEIGMDILNPIQTNAFGMDPVLLKKKYGHKVVFWGAIDAATTMAHGTREDVIREVDKKVSALGPTGYVLCENHNVQVDVPYENVIAMYEHAKEIKL